MFFLFLLIFFCFSNVCMFSNNILGLAGTLPRKAVLSTLSKNVFKHASRNLE